MNNHALFMATKVRAAKAALKTTAPTMEGRVPAIMTRNATNAVVLRVTIMVGAASASLPSVDPKAATVISPSDRGDGQTTITMRMPIILIPIAVVSYSMPIPTGEGIAR